MKNSIIENGGALFVKRRALHVSQKALADAMCISLATLIDIERGRLVPACPSLAELYECARLLHEKRKEENG